MSPDINRLRTLLLVDEDADEVLVRDDAVLSFRDGLPRLLAVTVGVRKFSVESNWVLPWVVLPWVLSLIPISELESALAILESASMPSISACIAFDSA